MRLVWRILEGIGGVILGIGSVFMLVLSALALLVTLPSGASETAKVSVAIVCAIFILLAGHHLWHGGRHYSRSRSASPNKAAA